MQEQITFNDLPMMVSQVLSKMERLERVIETIRERIDGNSTSSAEHIPMTIDEACDFLKMKKSTMYYHVERGNITVTKRGKNFIFFKDELVHWLEGGRKNQESSMNPDEENDMRLASFRRKPKGFYPRR
ncbi:MAG: helix-turn-helix domain-containing protein [Bacteroidales bacterium]|jgi:excisionase family DNA binding protein|nr:helix-turn-helix domain-containing protein [Bacteroidales bacterium]